MAMILIAAVTIPLGLILIFLKPADILAGYNTMSPEKKLEVDPEKLCVLAGSTLLAAGGGALLFFILQMWINWNGFLFFGIGWFFFSIVGGVIYMNTGDRTKKH